MTPKEAIQKQKELVKQLTLQPLNKKVKLVAGADISYSKNDPRLFSAVVLLKLPELEIVEAQTAVGKATFPYVPGLLAFREIPAVLKAYKKLKTKPDVLICDGQGIAHPRKMGLASHLGIVLNLPTIGCAKTLLVGEYGKLQDKKGAKTPLLYKGEQVGVVLRSREGVTPLYISCGHLIDFEGSVQIVKKCLTKYRQPETTRAAHRLVNELRLKG